MSVSVPFLCHQRIMWFDTDTQLSADQRKEERKLELRLSRPGRDGQ